MLQKKVITVLTPTYNRGYLLDNLYKSLIDQTYSDFIWLIIDDGSSDDTKNRVKSYMAEKKIDINYIYQENRGKYVAHNNGVKMCETELIVCVDSDDELYPQAIERTLNFWKNVKSDEKIAGIVSPKDVGGTSYFKNPPKKSSLMDLYDKGNLVGETMLVYRTEILRSYLFPEVHGEKFMSECVIYNQIDKKYELAVQDEYLYKAEYQDDGLTRNIDKLHWKNPKTTLIMYKAVAAFENDFVKAAKSYACYLAWKKVCKLDKFKEYSVNPCVKLAGCIFSVHYIKLFIKQKDGLQ